LHTGREIPKKVRYANTIRRKHQQDEAVIATVRARICERRRGTPGQEREKQDCRRGDSRQEQALRISRVLWRFSKGLLRRGEYSLKRRYCQFLVK